MARQNLLETDPSWRIKAACRDLDPNLFFPVGTTGPAIEETANAKSTCAQCISKVACLEYALENNEQYGIWGGATEDERQVIRRNAIRSVAK